MRTRSISLQNARKFVETHHRHHKAPIGWKFGTSLVNELNEIIGVVFVGRPVTRALDDGNTLEVTRLCTTGQFNACSKLYGIARRVAFELGYARLITYTLAVEEGASLRASGWRLAATIRGKSWNTPSRARVDKHPTTDKFRWEIENNKY